MFTIERQQNIMALLRAKKSVTVSELSKKFFIGEATIRRDLEKLENMGLLKRTYGGAVLLEGLGSETPLSIREVEQKDAKEAIGQLASQLVHDGDVLFMDSSSTVMRLIPYLKSKQDLTIITNGAKAAIELGGFFHFKVYSTGGMLRENCLSYIGYTARKSIEGYYADKIFFSCKALSMENGITDANEEEAELRSAMIKNSKKAVLLCDTTKFDKVSFCKICDFDKIDYIVTNGKLPSQWADFLQEKNIELMYG